MTKSYRPAWWLPDPHSMTLWPKLFRAAALGPTAVESWPTSDGDWITVVRIDAGYHAPRIILLHGLEGSQQSHYVRGMAAEVRARKWGLDLLLFRTCDGKVNATPRSYHSGETSDLDFVVRRVTEEYPEAPCAVVGVSLGANVALKWLGERCDRLPPRLCAAAAVSTPFELSQSSQRVHQGFSRVYERHFLRSLRRKALKKLDRFPKIAERSAVASAQSLRDFDEAFTSIVHGFENADDYYSRSSSLAFLPSIRIPTLLLSARDDPFHPPRVLDRVAEIAAKNPLLRPEFPQRGGHAGFVAGSLPGKASYYAERRIAEFCAHEFVRASETTGEERPRAGR